MGKTIKTRIFSLCVQLHKIFIWTATTANLCGTKKSPKTSRIKNILSPSAEDRTADWEQINLVGYYIARGDQYVPSLMMLHPIMRSLWLPAKI